MKLNLIHHLSKPGNIINEDCVGFESNFAILLDGSSGLRKNIIPNCHSDAKWFVEGFKDYLQENIKTDLTLQEIIKQGICEIRIKLDNYNLGVIDKVDQPSASLAVLRYNSDELEILSLGDCTILLETTDGKIIRIFDNSVSKLDKKVVDKMIKLKEKRKISILNTRKFVNDDLIRNRYMKNTKEGYWILGFDETAIEHGYYDKWSLKDLTSICIFSDGFADFYESMNISTDYIEFFKMLKDIGAENMYDRLRKEQDLDAECNIHPRLKQKDDASILLFGVKN